MMEGEGGIIRQKAQRPLPNNNSNGDDLKIATAAAMHSRRVLGLNPKQSVATLRGLHELNRKINHSPTAPKPPQPK